MLYKFYGITIDYERKITVIKSNWNVDGNTVRFYKILLLLVSLGWLGS